MSGETNLQQLLKTMKPELNQGEYVFCTTQQNIDLNEVLFIFKEKEGTTLVLEKQIANKLGLTYSFVASWITLTVHSSLEAVGLTAAFSTALTKENISCNVVAAYYHDHIFVDKNDSVKAMEVLSRIAAE